MPTSEGRGACVSVGMASVLGCVFGRVLLILGLIAPLGACQLSKGLSGFDAEIARQRAGDFEVVSVEDGRAVIKAKGRMVELTPAPGACIATDAIDLSERSAFMLLTDCAVTAPVVTAEATGRLHMAGAFPGLVTLSLAGEPRVDIDRLVAFLDTPRGQRQLARGQGERQVVMEEMRVIDDVVFVHARNRDEEAAPLLSRDFWRGFMDLNGRMGVVTVSGFQAAAMPSEAMFAEIQRQVNALTGGAGVYADAKALTGVVARAPAPAEAAPQAEVADLSDDLVFVPPPRPSRAAGAAVPGPSSRGTPVPGMPLPPPRPQR